MFVTDRIRSMGEGNVFTSICLSMGEGSSWMHPLDALLPVDAPSRCNRPPQMHPLKWMHPLDAPLDAPPLQLMHPLWMQPLDVPPPVDAPLPVDATFSGCPFSGCTPSRKLTVNRRSVHILLDCILYGGFQSSQT